MLNINKSTFVADREVIDYPAHACNFTSKAVVQRSGDAENDSSCSCVVKRVHVDVHHCSEFIVTKLQQ